MPDTYIGHICSAELGAGISYVVHPLGKRRALAVLGFILARHSAKRVEQLITALSKALHVFCWNSQIFRVFPVTDSAHASSMAGGCDSYTAELLGGSLDATTMNSGAPAPVAERFQSP